MLLGRSHELSTLLAALDASRSIVVVTGEAGIGKTALVDAALATRPGVPTLRVRATKADTPLPYGALHALLHPLLEHIDALPGPQALALRQAFALEPVAEPPDRFGVGAATLTLLTDAEPLIVVVDDGQWVDPPSWEALTFAAHRLDATAVTLVVTWRDETPVPGDLLDGEILHLEGLGPAALADLPAPRVVAPKVAEALHRSTGGNPLAVLELARALDNDQLGGRRALPDPMPAGRDIGEAFGRRIGRLAPSARRALLVLAAGGDLAPAEVSATLQQFGLPDDVLDEPETEGLVARSGTSVRLTHPLLRATVYTGAAPAERRAVHAALAGALHDHLRALWHRAEATLGADETLARSLCDAAADAAARGAHPAALRLYERAIGLTPPGEPPAGRLLRAADAAVASGCYPQADDLLHRALDASTDVATRVHAWQLLGRIGLWTGDVARVRAVLVHAAESMCDDHPALAALLVADAVLPALAAGDVDGALHLADRARALAAEDDATLRHVSLVGVPARVCAGRPDDTILPTLLSALDEAPPPAVLVPLVALPLLWLEEHTRARKLLRRALEEARHVNAPTVVPLVLTTLAELELRTGEVLDAHTHASEAIELGRLTGRANEVALGHLALARLEAMRGDAAAVEHHLAIIEAAGAAVPASVRTSIAAIRGLLHLGLGRHEEAVDHLRGASALAGEHGLANPAVIPWRADLVEALARSARLDDAATALHTFAMEADTTGGRWAKAAVARTRVLLAGPDEIDDAAASALAAAEPLDQPFEQARTRLAVGERFRRSKRRAEARPFLRTATESFERLGATGWAERAASELAATGERRTARRVATASLDDLTPQELRVALAVVGGGTNREVAAALFLSERTVESHLGRVFRKLGVRSRSELTALVLTRRDALA